MKGADERSRAAEASDAGETGKTTVRHRFPKAIRLRGADPFTVAIRNGAFAADDTLVVHLCANGKKVTRFGITIPRRTGNAVLRNRWKRLIRESIRHCRHRVPAGYDIVIRPKRDAVPSYRAVMRGLPPTIRRALKRFQASGKG